jgi:hypothetical protein
MTNDNLSRNDSLQLIESMINKAKNQFNENGTLYLLWGYTILLCCGVQFIMQYFFKSDKSYYVWFVTWAVVAYQIYFIAKRKKEEKVRTYTDSIIGVVWICFAVALFLLLFILSAYKAQVAINPVILVLYGIPTVLSGAIIKFRPLMIGGACCWALAFAAPFTGTAYQYLLLCAAVIAAWIIPGHLLRKRYQNQQ